MDVGSNHDITEKQIVNSILKYSRIRKEEIGPITTTRVMRGQVPSGTFSSRTSKKVSTKASAIRTPCTTR